MRQKRRSRDEWEKLFKQWSESGSSIVEFCRQHDINVKMFAARKSDWQHQWKTRNKGFFKVNASTDAPLIIQCRDLLLRCHHRAHVDLAAHFIKAIS